MFEIASKKLGLEQVVLGGVKKTDNPEAGIANAMSSEEVEKVNKPYIYIYLMIYV